MAAARANGATGSFLTLNQRNLCFRSARKKHHEAESRVQKRNPQVVGRRGSDINKKACQGFRLIPYMEHEDHNSMELNEMVQDANSFICELSKKYKLLHFPERGLCAVGVTVYHLPGLCS